MKRCVGNPGYVRQWYGFERWADALTFPWPKDQKQTVVKERQIESQNADLRIYVDLFREQIDWTLLQESWNQRVPVKPGVQDGRQIMLVASYLASH